MPCLDMRQNYSQRTYRTTCCYPIVNALRKPSGILAPGCRHATLDRIVSPNSSTLVNVLRNSRPLWPNHVYRNVQP